MRQSLYRFLSLPVFIVSLLAFAAPAHADSAATPLKVALFQSFDENFASQADFQRAASVVNFVWGAAGYNVSIWKQYNQSIKLSYYLPFNRDPEVNDLQWWQTNHPDWVMYRCDKHTPAYKNNEPNIPLDISNPAVRSWQLQNFVLPAAQQGYTAIGWDNLDPDWYGACGHYQNGQWVQLYSGNTDDANWRRDVLDWLAFQKQQLHALQTPLLSIPNVDFSGWAPQGLPVLEQITDNSDQILEEQGFIGPGRITASLWSTLRDWLLYTQAHGKMFYSSNGTSHDPDETDVLWTLANYLLINQGNLSLWLSRDQAYGVPVVSYPQYQAASALQFPTSQLYLSQNLYRRDYAGGLALVNTDSTAHTFTFTGQKKDLDGNSVSGQITVQPGAGVVLLNA